MTPAGYAFRTWLVAHALHPMVWVMGSLMFSGTQVDGDILVGLYLGFFALFFSLPSIWISWGIVDVILNTSMPVLVKFVVWLFCAPLITYINAILMIWILSGSYEILNHQETIMILTPAMIATMLSVVIRSRQFFIVNAEVMKKNNTEDIDQTLEF